MVTVVGGVTFSVLALAIFDRLIASHRIPLTAFGIYWALALPYVGAQDSGDVVRGYSARM